MIGDLEDEGFGGTFLAGELQFAQARPVVEGFVAFERVERIDAHVGDGGEDAAFEHGGGVFGRGLRDDEQRGLLFDFLLGFAGFAQHVEVAA